MTTTPPHRRVPAWPLAFLALPAAVAIWAGWVGLGGMTGFGEVQLLPGIWDAARINTAITLPIGMEAYAAYAMRAWLTKGTPTRARAFAKHSAIGALVLGTLGQIAYHLMAAAGVTAAPWVVTMLVSCLPVAVLGMGAALYHLLDDDPDEQAPTRPAVTAPEAAAAAPFRTGGFGTYPTVVVPVAAAWTPAVATAAATGRSVAATAPTTGRWAVATAAEQPAEPAVATATTAAVRPVATAGVSTATPAAAGPTTTGREPVATGSEQPAATAGVAVVAAGQGVAEQPVETPTAAVATAAERPVVRPAATGSTAAVEPVATGADDRRRDRATTGQRPRSKTTATTGRQTGRGGGQTTAKPDGNDHGLDLSTLLPHARRILAAEPALGQRLLAQRLSEALGVEVPRYWAGRAKGRVEELRKQEWLASGGEDEQGPQEVPRLVRVAGA